MKGKGIVEGGSKRKNLKRKRDDSGITSFICRHNLCTNLHYDNNEVFCERHRVNLKKSSTDLFYSSTHDLVIPEDIIVEILIYNIPYINKLIMKIDPYNPQFPFNLKKTAIKSIFSYLGKVSLISKTIQSVFNDVIKDLYPRIYMLDIKNQRIVDKTLPTGNCIIGDLYCESPDKFLMHKTNEINEYYRNRIISKIASDKATLIKKRITANLLSNSNIKKRYRYDDKGKCNYSRQLTL